MVLIPKVQPLCPAPSSTWRRCVLRRHRAAADPGCGKAMAVGVNGGVITQCQLRGPQPASSGHADSPRPKTVPEADVVWGLRALRAVQPPDVSYVEDHTACQGQGSQGYYDLTPNRASRPEIAAIVRNPSASPLRSSPARARHQQARQPIASRPISLLIRLPAGGGRPASVTQPQLARRLPVSSA
jgi:hypothetical protein